MADGDDSFPLMQGGPFHALLKTLGVVRDGKSGAVRPAALFIALLWAPLIVLGVASWMLQASPPAILRDAALHARLLVSLPLLFVADGVVEQRCAVAVARFVGGGLSDDPQKVRAVIDRNARARQAHAPEALMLVLAIAFGQYVFWNQIGVSGLFGAKVDRVVSASFGWYCFVSLPAYQFLVLRWLYRWLLWSITLIGFSKSSVHPISTHPDQSGGLAAMAEPVAGFAVFLSAVNVVVASAWAEEILRRGRDLASFAATFACLALISALLALAPLLSFSENLVRARLEGLRQYGKLAYDYSRRFHDRWIVDGNQDALLGTSDIQSLADLGNTYERLTRMRPVPFGLHAAIWIAAATAGPVLPLLATKVPVTELFSHVVRTMLGF